jgi:SAM-dependent methyltransferase
MKTFDTQPRVEATEARPCPICGGLSFKPRWSFSGFAFATCAVCGLVQQNPQPLASAVLARYGPAYLAYEVENQVAYRDLARLALADLDFAGATRELRIAAARQGGLPSFLDVGCATGALLASLGAEGWAPSGVEPCVEAAVYGREVYGLDIRASRLEEASLPASSFDVVHASQVIEHLNDPGVFLDTVRGLLKPGGLLILATPNCRGFQARLFRGRWRSAIHDHLYLFSPETLHLLLESHGFLVERLVTWGGWARGLRPAFLKAPLDRAAKKFGFGDMMALIAKPIEGGEHGEL